MAVELDHEPIEREEDILDLALQALEPWESEEFGSKDEYELHYIKHVNRLLKASQREFRPIKERWDRVYARLELEDILTHSAFNDPVLADMPLLAPVVEEMVAMLCESVPRGYVEGPGPQFEDTAAAINALLNKVFDANDYEDLNVEQCTDGLATNLGVLSPRIDALADGPFGMQGEVLIEKVDPRDCWPDPHCKRLSSSLRDMAYFIRTHDLDCAQLEDMFGDVARDVTPEAYEDDDDGVKRHKTSGIDFGKNNDEYTGLARDRWRCVLKELWLRDMQMHYVPLIDGMTLKPLRKTDGSIAGRWERKYPHGRVIYVANNVLLRDIPNPFPHKHIPYVFFSPRKSTKPFSWGLVEALLLMENQINKLDKDSLLALLYNMSSPWIAEEGVFIDRDDIDDLSNAPDQVILTNTGFAGPNSIRREAPGMLPQDRQIIREEKGRAFDQVSGTGGITRGDLAKGAQLSAQAIQQLQGAGGSRQRLRIQNMGRSVKELTYQTWHILTELYSEAIPIQINGPDGQAKQVKWDPSVNKDLYQLKADVGSGLAGAKEGARELAFRLYEANAIDRAELLQAVQWRKAAEVLRRMKQWDMLKLQLLEDPDYKQNRSGSAGRKARYGN